METAAELTVQTEEALQPIAIDPHIEEALYRRARERLPMFAHLITPGGYTNGAHLDQLMLKLEQVERGECTRLIVEEPPRHGKSMTVSQIFPTWYLGKHPRANIIQSGYSSDITMFHSRKSRDLLASPRYHRIFPEVTHAPERESQRAVAVEKQAAHEWGTTQGGRYYAVGVGGGLTGRGANIAIIDDPVKNREEANSEVVRRKIEDWYKSTLYTRLTPKGAIILVMTRWHPGDLAGILESEMQSGGEKWDVLKMPAISKENTALWPEVWTLEKLQQIKRAIGSVEFSALYQQEPHDPESCIFRREWFEKFYDHEPAGLQYARAWDLAVTEKTSADYTAGAKIAMDADGTIILSDMVHGKWEMPEAVQVISATAKRDGPRVTQLVEYVGTQKAFLQTLLRDPTLAGYTFLPVEVTKDKVTRARPLQARCEVKKFAMVRGLWNAGTVQELIDFSPVCLHDDRVDAITGALQYYAGDGIPFQSERVNLPNRTTPIVTRRHRGALM